MKKLNATPISSVIRKFSACLLTFCMVNVPLWAISGGKVIRGDASASSSLVQLLSGNRAVVNWNDFNTINGQTIEFRGVNMSDSFAVLNRVIAGGETQFHGNLIGNQGHILLINPHGIVFGPTANISAARFTASTMHLFDDANFSNFMSGSESFRFVKGSSDPGAQIALLLGSQINAQRVDLLAQQIINQGTITTGKDGLVVLATGDDVFLKEPGSEIIVEVDISDTPADYTYNVINDVPGSIESPEGTIIMAAGDTFAQAINTVQNNAYAANTFTASQRGTLNSHTLEIGAANQADINTLSTTTANEIKIAAKKVLLEETVESSGSMIIDADYDIDALEGLKSGDTIELKAKTVQVRENIDSGSTVTIDADKLYSRGDIESDEDLLLNVAETLLWGDVDQTIRSENKSVKSTGTITKHYGNLYISATDDVQLDDDVSAVDGGVSVIAKTGKIHTGDGTDTLNIAISGYSNEITDSIGVDLPDGEGKAAIVLESHDTLNLGPDAELKAEGFYLSADDDPDNGVDNRPDITWLDTDGTYIGGHERDEGIASDVAIYVGSETGDVNVETTQIETAQPGDVEYIGEEEQEIISGPATVIFDAQDTVTMPSLGEIEQERTKQGNGNLFRFRLEVASRITEWLYQAVQGAKLPYADNPEAVEQVLGNDYVLRGAGLNNPAITVGRIWVLENPPSTPPERKPTPQPPLAPVAPLAKYESPELVGCPVEMEAAASELDINSDELQLKIQNSMATNPNLQPCEACARLLVAADALRDEDGIRLAAMNAIFNTLAPADIPFTEEAAASIATAFMNLADKDPQYALAGDYIDAFVDYIAVLDEDLKTPIGDAVVYTLNKYGEAIMSNPNQNIVSYLVEKVKNRKNVQDSAQIETDI